MKTTTRAVSLLLSIGIAASAATVPVLFPDGVSLDPASPGLGVQVFAVPGSTWLVGFNDNWAFGPDDQDFNDAWLRLIFGADGTMDLQYIASVSADNIAVRQQDTGPYIGVGSTATYGTLPNQLVTLQAFDATVSHTYVSGPGALNPDGAIHAWAEMQPADVPEPAAMTLAGLGLLAMGFLRKRLAR